MNNGTPITLHLSLDDLKERIFYSPETGIFRWLKAKRKDVVGREAGYKNGAGYISISIDGRSFLAHRLAWFYSYGIWPNVIDHVDRNRTNNRLSNLRDCTHSQNQANRSARGSFGIKGITKARGWGYQAQISSGNRTRYIGAFKTPEKAHSAYMTEARRIHGEFASS